VSVMGAGSSSALRTVRRAARALLQELLTHPRRPRSGTPVAAARRAPSATSDRHLVAAWAVGARTASVTRRFAPLTIGVRPPRATVGRTAVDALIAGRSGGITKAANTVSACARGRQGRRQGTTNIRLSLGRAAASRRHPDRRPPASFPTSAKDKVPDRTYDNTRRRAKGVDR